MSLFIASAVLGLLAATAAPSDQPGVLDEYVVTSWGVEDGLPGSWIQAIAQDDSGYIWLATEDGLIRFDGVGFTRVDAINGTPLPDRIAFSLCAARDGSLWVGFAFGGISRIRDGRLTNYGQPDGFTGQGVRAIREDQEGVVWAGTRDGLFRFRNNRWQLVGPLDGLQPGPVNTVYPDRTGVLWAGTSHGVVRRKPGEERFETVDASLRHSPSFSEDPDGSIWVTDLQVGFRRLADPHANRRVEIVREGIGDKLLHDRRGNLWVATAGQGLWFTRNRSTQPSTIEVVGKDAALSNAAVLSLFEDREGNIWVGTQGTQMALHKLSLRRVTAITDLGLVRAIEIGPDGAIWVGTATGLIRLSGTERRLYGTQDGLPSPHIAALRTDGAGALWIATASGLARFLNGRITPLPLLDDTWPTQIIALTNDLAGNLWIVDKERGLVRWHNGRLLSFDPSPQVSGRAVDSAKVDREGRTWLMIVGGGIGVMEPNGVFRLIRRSDGSHPTNYGIHVDGEGAVWFGGDTLSRFKNGKLDVITRQNGFPDSVILAITDDGQGNIWIGTNTGIVRLSEAEFNRAAEDGSYQVDFRLYDSSDGLAGMPVRIGHQNVIRGPDGRLWFVSGRGLTVVDPRLAAASRPLPQVRIEQIAANGRRFDPVAQTVLPPRTTSLQFDYTALTFLSPTNIQFRYRLEGFDQNWVDAGSRRQAFYTNLPPRSYRFHVLARSHEGIWNENGAVLDFSIEPTFYQTTWFYPACAVVLGLAVWGSWQLKERRIRRRFALILAERVRLGREIHDTLLQSLVGVALQLETASSTLNPSAGTAKEQFGDMRRQVERYIREARQSIWDLRSPTLESRDLVTALREASARATDDGRLKVEFAVDGDPLHCPTKIEEQILRIGEEAISNALRHSAASQVRVQLQYEADSIRLRVSDDGIGFTPKDPAMGADKHCGLLIMQERSEQVGGHFTLFSKPGAGTQVEAFIPISEQTRTHVEATH